MARRPEPGERRDRPVLDRPPGERYEPRSGAAETGAPTTDVAASAGRGLAWGGLVAIAGAALIVVLAGPLAVTLGLLIVAAVLGRFVAVAIRAGAGQRLAPRARAVAAVVIALAGVLVGQLGVWLFARSEGGVLGLVDYLGQTFGPLVPLQLALAAVVAWWTAR